MTQATLFDTHVKPLTPTQQEVMEALKRLIIAGDTSDIERALAEHGIRRQRNCIAKRLCELEDMGLVGRCGKDYPGKSTTWRRLV